MIRQRGCTVWIVSPPGYLHRRCFEEVALALCEGLQGLGVAARIARQPEEIVGAPLVLGGHLLGADTVLPPGAILFNLEQIESGSGFVSPDYLALLRRHRVLDYTALNIAALQRLGVAASLCPIGYSPVLERIARAREHDIDVLFVGSLCERRQSVLSALHKRGARVARVFGLYGPERDAYVARAKIVLNLHFYPTAIFEVVRVSYLLANRICVVSETGPDAAMEGALKDGVAFAAYDGLVETCERLLADGAERARLAAAGHAAIRRIPQGEALARALA